MKNFHIWDRVVGGNGKSKIIKLYEKAIGDYGCKIPISLLTSNSETAKSKLDEIKGKRFACFDVTLFQILLTIIQ